MQVEPSNWDSSAPARYVRISKCRIGNDGSGEHQSNLRWECCTVSTVSSLLNISSKKRKHLALFFKNHSVLMPRIGTLANKQFSDDVPQRRRAKIWKWASASYICYESSLRVYKTFLSGKNARMSGQRIK